jgi:hypothetical protein
MERRLSVYTVYRRTVVNDERDGLTIASSHGFRLLERQRLLKLRHHLRCCSRIDTVGNIQVSVCQDIALLRPLEL